VSRVIFGKEDYVSFEVSFVSIHQQKLLFSRLKVLHSCFKNSQPGIKVGFLNVVSLHYRNSVTGGASDIHSACACLCVCVHMRVYVYTIHQNVI
jgi:hypothetical protein